MRGVLTSDWPLEKLAPYGADITAAFHKLADRFPRDAKPEAMFRQCMAGELQLWLVLEGDEFRSVVLTKLQTNPDTGWKNVVVTSMAGEDGADAAGLISLIEDWARENGADEVTVTGRLGWKRLLAPHGYRLDFAYYRKEL